MDEVLCCVNSYNLLLNVKSICTPMCVLTVARSFITYFDVSFSILDYLSFRALGKVSSFAVKCLNL
jgi:hypothetical protein